MANDNLNPPPLTEPHPDYLAARRRGVPQIYPPYPFVNWMAGEQSPDDLSPLGEGERLSPKAVRSTIAAYCAGVVIENRGLIPPHSRQAAMAAAMYAYFNDFVTQEEVMQMAEGKAIFGNHCETEADLLTSEHPLFHSSVFSTLEAAAMDPRWLAPGKTKVFLHGTWNGFPHPGHILYIHDTLSQVQQLLDIPLSEITVMVAGDQNAEIQALGKKPAMDTLMRLSFMSYLPDVDLVAPSGSWLPGGNIDTHWSYKLGLIKPDFVSYDPAEPNFAVMAERARAAGVTVLQNTRAGEQLSYDPHQRLPLKPLPGKYISSRHLGKGIVGEADKNIDFQFTNPLARLLAIKRINQEIHGNRNWFADEARRDP